MNTPNMHPDILNRNLIQTLEAIKTKFSEENFNEIHILIMKLIDNYLSEIIHQTDLEHQDIEELFKKLIDPLFPNPDKT